MMGGRIKGAANGFCTDERGAMTIFWLLCIMILCLIVGLAVDVTNAHRFKERLTLAADAGAQAGIVALAGGKSEADVNKAVLAAIEANAAAAYIGVLSGKGDVELVRFDPKTGSLTSGSPNAVKVTLHKDETVKNPIRTGFLRLAGVDRFDLSVTTVAYFGQPGNCTSSDMIYGKGKVTLTSGNRVGPSYCVHSQTAVWLPQQNTFERGSGVSMPNLADCKGKCVNSANPGIEDAAFESNLNLPNIADHIRKVSAAMLADTSEVKTAYFREKVLARDLSMLVSAKILTAAEARKLVKGSVVNLTDTQYNDLMLAANGSLPTGLVYQVSCREVGNGASSSIQIGAGRRGKSSASSSAIETIREVAIVTNCALEVGDYARIEASLVVSTRVSSSSVLKAGEGAALGDPQKGCDLGRKVYIMMMSGVSVPANFTASNVALMVNGDINIAANSASSSVTHRGASLFAEGSIQIAANNTFNSCAADSSGLIPVTATFKFVVPKS